MFKKKLVRLIFKVTPEEKLVIEEAMSAVRGNIGTEAGLEEERGQALIAMAKTILCQYKHS